MTFNIFGVSSTAYVLSTIITLSVIAVFVAIIIDFIMYNNKNTVKKSKRSIVATGSMIAFYIAYYLVLRFRLGSIYGGIYFINIHIIFLGNGIDCYRYRYQYYWQNTA